MVAIFQSFQQTAEEIYDLSHFKQEHVPFFNKTTFYQLKDGASAVLAHEKSTSLAEIFSVELKFTVDTLNEWFSRVIKTNFFELDDIKTDKFKGKSNRSVQNNLFNLWVSTECRQ